MLAHFLSFPFDLQNDCSIRWPLRQFFVKKMCLSPERFLHGSEGLSRWPHPVEVFTARIFSGTVAGRVDSCVDAANIWLLKLCLSLGRTLSSIYKNISLFRDTTPGEPLLTFCSGAAWCFKLLWAFHTQHYVSLCVEGGAFLCGNLF